MKDTLSSGFIDAHVHLWSSPSERYPFNQRFSVQDIRPRQFLTSDLFSHTQPAGVDRVVLIQMSYYGTDNSYMLSVMAEHPGIFAGVGIVDHHSSTLEDDIQVLASQKVRGFRINVSDSDVNGWPKDAGMLKLWEVCQSQGLAVCPLINPFGIDVIKQLCERFPQTIVVIDHMARIGVGKLATQEQINELSGLAKYPNVYIKTSAFYAMGDPPHYLAVIPTIQQLFESYGSGRLMWGSDCPYQVQRGPDYASSLKVIAEGCTFLSDLDRQAILKNTAESVFFADR